MVMHDHLNPYRRATTFGISGDRKPKMSKANCIKRYWLSKHVFSYLITLLDAIFKGAYFTIKVLTLNPTNDETTLTHTCDESNQVHTYMFSKLNWETINFILFPLTLNWKYYELIHLYNLSNLC